MTLTVHVTQSDINAGAQATSCSCPIALAIKRACGTTLVNVMGTSVRINDKVYSLPDCCEEFVWGWDISGKGEPFSFDVDLAKPISDWMWN
jgi:hypothetical protein